MRTLLILPVCLSLAGCAGSPVGDAIAGPEKLAAQDDAYCTSLGAIKGTQPYMTCRMTLTQQRETKMNTFRSARSSSSTICNQVGTTIICN